jgi:NitT/TauT family transport system substrate-binding protein
MNAPKNLKSLVAIAGLLLLLIVTINFFTSIFSKSNIPFGSAPPSPPLKIGTNVWVGYEPLYLARELGFYETGSIRLVEYTSATQVARAYRNNAIQVAALTLDETLLLLESGLNAHVILVMDISNGGDAILAKPEIKSLNDLRGKRVGVERDAIGTFFLSKSLQKGNVPISEIKIIPAEVNQQERLFLTGKLDAVVTFEPVRSRLIAKGAKQIFDSSQVPGEIVDVLIIEKDSLEQFPDEVNTLLVGWFKALEYLQTHPEKAAPLMARRLKLSPEEVLDSHKGLIFPDITNVLELMTEPESSLKKTAEKLSEIMLENKFLQKKVIPEDFIIPEILEKLVKSGQVQSSASLDVRNRY